MSKKAISRGAVHSVPADLRKALLSDATARAKWEDITPLARNEWICWVLSVKKPETFLTQGLQVQTLKPEGSTLSGYARNLRKECAGPVAGQAVLTAEVSSSIRRLPSRAATAEAPPFQYPKVESS